MRSSSGGKPQSATSRRLLLTDTAIARLSCQKGGRLICHDSQLAGFQIVVGARTKNFRIRVYRSFTPLGSWPVVSADEARAAALTLLRNSLAAGPLYSDYEGILVVRPQQKPPRMNASSLTLQQLLDVYLSIRRLKPRTAEDYQSVIDRYAKDWRNADWQAITTDSFETRFSIVSERSHAQANYLVRVVSALWSFGCAKYDVDLPSPTKRIKALGGLHVIKPKDRLLPDALHPKWWKEVAALRDKEASAFLAFVALTGCRRSEALGLEATDIDWHSRTVTFPDTKNGMTHRLPLGNRLFSCLYDHCHGRNGRVFRLNGRGIMVSTAEVSKRIGFKWTAHDLRRTFVTVAQRTLRDLATVKKLVNHSSGADVTMKHYLRLSVEDLREPMQRVEDAFDHLRTQPHIFGEKI